MRVAVLSDIHSNLQALEAVLASLGSVDAIWVLGDIVGYGPEPDAVIARLRELGAIAVRGNHDAAALGALDTADFNGDARRAVEWTSDVLSVGSRAWLDSLPERRVEADAFTLVHGSPREPLWEYVWSIPVARRNMEAFSTRYCLVGHTHVPVAFVDGKDGLEVTAPDDDTRLELDERRAILNPGGVGQPRDGDPRACAMVLDTDAGLVSWRRVAYPFARTQELMRSAGLPSNLVERLAYGV
jgi:predicted phosphodiesterase